VPRRWTLNVLLQDFEDSPLVLLVGERPGLDRQVDLNYRQLRVLGIDKRTGALAVDWDRPSESGGFVSLHIDPEQRKIELKTYNERLLLRPRPEGDKASP
jgi:hypothetical protein